MKQPISLNDVVTIKMTLMQANLLRMCLHLGELELKDIDAETSASMKKFKELVQKNLDELDFSGNEALVDSFNKQVEEGDI